MCSISSYTFHCEMKVLGNKKKCSSSINREWLIRSINQWLMNTGCDMGAVWLVTPWHQHASLDQLCNPVDLVARGLVFQRALTSRTLIFDLAEDSKKAQWFHCLARFWPCSFPTTRSSSKSHLFPTRIIGTWPRGGRKKERRKNSASLKQTCDLE